MKTCSNQKVEEDSIVLFPNSKYWDACPLIAFGLIRLHKLECIRDVSTSNQNSQEVSICWTSILLTLRHKPPGSHQSCGMFGITDALKLRNDDSAPKSANQCNVARRRGRPSICGFARRHLWPLIVLSPPNHTHSQIPIVGSKFHTTQSRLMS